MNIDGFNPSVRCRNEAPVKLSKLPDASIDRAARSGAGGARGGGGRMGAADFALLLVIRRIPPPSTTTGAVVGRFNSISVEFEPLLRSAPDVGGRFLINQSMESETRADRCEPRLTLELKTVWRYSDGRHCCSDDDANVMRIFRRDQ